MRQNFLFTEIHSRHASVTEPLIGAAQCHTLKVVINGKEIEPYPNTKVYLP